MTEGCSWRWAIGAVALAAIGCGSVSPANPDGSAGQSGQGSAGATGSAGASAGATGSAGASGGASGGAGQGGAGGAPDAGTDAANPCHGLTEVVCTATPGCQAARCIGCDTASFSGCYQPATESPPPCPGLFCPPPPPVACSALTETMCLARTDCRADYCPGCQAKSFVKCSLPNDPQPQCPAIKCVAPCSSVTTLADCEARTDCHSVFFDPGTCGCAAAGCCAHFQKCVDGDKAACTGMVACTIVKPYCELPYVVSFSGSCYEGCVKQTDCAP